MSGAIDSLPIRYIAAPQTQAHQVIFLPIVNYTNPTQIQPPSNSKFNSFNIFNKHHQSPQPYKTIHFPPRKYKSDSYTAESSPQPNRRFDYNFYDRNDNGNFDQSSSFNHRDGWSYGGLKGGKQSPAISALALLGFLFFLNLIQNSLLNNRLLLTTSAYNNTAIGSNIAYGRNGRVRRKRGLVYNEYISTPESILTHPNRQLQQKHFGEQGKQFNNPDTSSRKVRFLSGIRMRRDRQLHNQPTILFNNSGTIVKGWVVQQLQQAAVGCLQLVACNMGRTIFKDAAPSGGGMVMRFLGQRLFSGSSTKRSWTGRMVRKGFRAMSYGWGKIYQCDKLFRRCILPNPFRLLLRT